MRPAATSAESRPVAALAAGAQPPARVCLDCGSVLTGRFCSVCGQKDEPLKRGLKDLALEFVQHPLIDTKLWRSLVLLLLRPGALTEEYLAGRRTRYVRPLKLYLTVSVTFFALVALLRPDFTYVSFSPDKSPAAVDGKPAKKDESDEFHLPVRWLDERVHRSLAKAQGPESAAYARTLSHRFGSMLPKMVFVLLPISALLFKLFWRKRYFVEHLVFTLHLHAYAFTANMLLLPRWAPVTGVVAVWSLGYAGLSFKRVYRDGWGKTVAKVLAAGFLYSIIIAASAAFATLVLALTD